MENQTNRIKLIGTVISEPVLDHESNNEQFFTFKFEVKRYSGEPDTLSVLISENFLLQNKVAPGIRLDIEGQIRSFNKLNKESNKSQLLISVFVLSVKTADTSNDVNDVYLLGNICKAPTKRTTPFGRIITDMLVAVNRAYGKSDYLPIIIWGRNAVFAENLYVGLRVELVGRLQSREYEKRIDENSTETRTAYEVSASSIKVIEQEAKE